MSLTPSELSEIQGRDLSAAFKHSHNSPIPRSMSAVKAFENADRKYGAAVGQPASQWVGIYLKKESEPAPVAA